MNVKCFPYMLFFICGLILLNACRKCQTCKVKDAVGNTIFYSDEKCETPSGIKKYKDDLAKEWLCYNYTVRDSDDVIIYVSPQICGHINALDSIRGALYQNFIADSPSVSVTQLTTRVECANHGE